MLTKEQLQQRLNYVTGTDASAICGLSPYKSKVNVWLEKTRRAEQEDISNANHIKFGNFMENGTADWFVADSGRELHPKSSEMLIHPEHEWMAGNIDFRVKGENAILECKTALSTDGWGDGENTIPAHYLMQVAHYCAVGGFDKAYIAVVFTMTRELRWYEYERNLELEEKLIKLEKDFWFNHVLADVAPDPKTENDVMAMFKETVPDPIQGTEDVIECVYNLYNTKKKIKELEAEEQIYRDKITTFMRDHDTLLDTSGKIIMTWKLAAAPKSFDHKALAANDPDTHNKYLKSGNPQRRLLIKVK